jgi:putative membrane protein
MRRTMLSSSIAILGIVALTACNQNTSSNTPQNPPANQTATNEPSDQSNANRTAANEPAPGSTNSTVAATKDSLAGAVGTLSAELTTSTKGLVEGAASGDIYEIEASKIALTRSMSDDVKKFAQQMINDHTQTTNLLRAALEHAKLNVEPPKMLDSRHQQMIDDLKGVKDEDFDARYISQQESAHNEALILIRGYAKDGDTMDLKMFAQATQPRIEMHLDTIKMIDDARRAGGSRAENR